MARTAAAAQRAVLNSGAVSAQLRMVPCSSNYRLHAHFAGPRASCIQQHMQLAYMRFSYQRSTTSVKQQRIPTPCVAWSEEFRQTSRCCSSCSVCMQLSPNSSLDTVCFAAVLAAVIAAVLTGMLMCYAHVSFVLLVCCVQSWMTAQTRCLSRRLYAAWHTHSRHTSTQRSR